MGFDNCISLQGLAVAAATREAAKRKREADSGPAEVKRPVRPVPVISHEVAVPKDYDEAARKLDPALHGEAFAAVQRNSQRSSLQHFTLTASLGHLIGHRAHCDQAINQRKSS